MANTSPQVFRESSVPIANEGQRKNKTKKTPVSAIIRASFWHITLVGIPQK